MPFGPEARESHDSQSVTPLPNLRPRHLDRREAIAKIQKHPPGTFGPLVRPRDINRTPAIIYTDHAYLRGPNAHLSARSFGPGT